MILQNIVFPKAGICSETEMYFRKSNKISYISEQETLDFKTDEIIKFNTYFNSFSIGKWSKYTQITDLSLNLYIKGNFVITVYRAEIILDKVVEELLSQQQITKSERSEISIPLKSNSNTGMYYFTLQAKSNNSQFFGGYYSTNTAEDKKTPTKLGVSICHFKKDNYILHNLSSINDYLKAHPDFKNGIEVFVSDNGKTLPESPYKFAHIFPNKNVGGAGGFTRCIIEIQKSNASGNKITHSLLMDDDLTFDPECLYRTWAFLSYIKPDYKEYFFGGAMCRLDTRNIQHENGALWNKGDICSLKHMDLNIYELLLFNDCYEECPDFAAWWFCAIPISITENNLPLPIFYREDDVEYSLRNAKGIITMNGICVWHEPFENKFVPFVCYYHSRNRHIANAIHYSKASNTSATQYRGKFNTKRVMLEFTHREIMRECACLRYKIADLFLDAAFDFLKGIDWLLKTDTEALHKDIMTQGYKYQDVDKIKNIPFLYGEYAKMLNKQPYKGLKRIIWGLSDRGYRLKAYRVVYVPIAIEKIRPNMFAYAKIAYNYDQCSHKAFITTRSKKEYRRIKRRYRKLVFLANRKYNKVAREYASRYNELTALSFWTKYLELDK